MTETLFSRCALFPFSPQGHANANSPVGFERSLLAPQVNSDIKARVVWRDVPARELPVQTQRRS